MSTNSDKKILALALQTAKFTAKELLALIKKYLELLKNNEVQETTLPYQEFQHSGGVPLLNLAPKEQEFEDLEEITAQNNVNLSLKQDKDNDTYYLCLQGNLKDIHMALQVFEKLYEKELSRTQPTIVKNLEKAQEKIEQQNKQKAKPREQQR